MAVHQANTEPLPGYRLLEPLGKGGFGAVWKCEAPGGLIKAIKFVEGDRDGVAGQVAPADVEWQAVQHVKAIRHPFLISLDRVALHDGVLSIALERAAKTLPALPD